MTQPMQGDALPRTFDQVEIGVSKFWQDASKAHKDDLQVYIEDRFNDVEPRNKNAAQSHLKNYFTDHSDLYNYPEHWAEDALIQIDMAVQKFRAGMNGYEMSKRSMDNARSNLHGCAPQSAGMLTQKAQEAVADFRKREGALMTLDTNYFGGTQDKRLHPENHVAKAKPRSR